MNAKYVSYVRVSTSSQGVSGLGLEAQREAIARYLNSSNGSVVAEFTEIESGKRADRPQLAKAIELCKSAGYTLLVAKLDRLARNLHFVTTLQRSNVSFVACDNPHATPFVIHILCAVAEQEAVAISNRTKAALEACKRRGVRLGNPNPDRAVKMAVEANQTQASEHCTRMLPIIQEIQAAKITSLRGIAHVLNVRGYKSRTGKPYAAQTVKNILERAA
ncbi:MAG TPA: recombinase family protein [Verrucomicrobiae bacterium]|nr:recombinase family protein [Verrucomicrobiae bacterium]